MKNKIKRKHPAFWLIRHRSGNIRDHPQRYHINVGKKYTGGDYRVNSNERNFKKLKKDIEDYEREIDILNEHKRKLNEKIDRLVEENELLWRVLEKHGLTKDEIIAVGWNGSTLVKRKLKL